MRPACRHSRTPLPPIPLRRRLYGFGSIYGKTIRDSRLAFLVMTGLIAGFMLAIGQAFGTAYGTRGDAAGDRQPRGHGATRHGGHGRQSRRRGHHRRLHHLEVRPLLRPARRAVVDPGPVRHAGRRGPARQPGLRGRRSVRQAAGGPREADRARHRRRPLDDVPGTVHVGGGVGLRRPCAGRRDRRDSRRSGSRSGSGSSASVSGPWPSRWHLSWAGQAPPAWPAWSCCSPSCVGNYAPYVPEFEGHREPLLVLLDLRPRPAGGAVRLGLAGAGGARHGRSSSPQAWSCSRAATSAS